MFGVEHVDLGDGVLHGSPFGARILCGTAKARHRHLGLDRLHQLIGDEHLAAADIPLRRDAGVLVQFAKARDRTGVGRTEIAAADQIPVLKLQSNGLLHHLVPQQAGVWVAPPHLVMEPRQDARQRFCEQWPHFTQVCPHRLVDPDQIEADGVPVRGHRRLRGLRNGDPAYLVDAWLTECKFIRNSTGDGAIALVAHRKRCGGLHDSKQCGVCAEFTTIPARRS